MTLTSSGLSLWRWRQWAKNRLQALHPELQSQLETELDWLLQDVTHLDKLSLRLETYREQPEVVLKRSLPDLTELWQHRLEQRQPLQHLLGKTAWRHFTLSVTSDVLIPRPETESLVDLAVDYASELKTDLEAGHWADIGTGSGAIALGLATAFPQASVHAVDVSGEALAIATQNAISLELQHRIQFYQGSWLTPLLHFRGNLSGIISNPPYIPSAMVPTLQPEVAWHEPHLALDGGADGLEALRDIVTTAPQFLRSGGLLLLEMMSGQAPQVSELLEQQGEYCEIAIHSDLEGIERFAKAFRR